MDLSINSLLASPKMVSNPRAISKLDQLDKILSKMNSYDTTKVDIEKINREAKLEAKKTFFKEIDDLQLIQNFPELNHLLAFGGFNKACLQISESLNDNGSIFINQPFLMFKKEDFSKDKKFNAKSIRHILENMREDKLKMLKTALKLMSIENNLDNILAIKKVLIDELICASIVDVYATLIKILINFGIDLQLLDRYIIKFQNIRSDSLFKSCRPKQEHQSQNDFGLNMIQSFVHIVDILEITVNGNLIHDHQILADYVSLMLILYSEREWRFNMQCLNSLSNLFAFILKRAGNSTSAIKIVSKTISNFFKNEPENFFEFLDFFPDNTTNLANVKFALCKLTLKKYQIKIAHTESRVDSTFASLRELKCEPDEIKLIIGLIDHFYQTRELNDNLSQHISNHLVSFAKNYEFGPKANQKSIEFQQYLCSLVKKYDVKLKERSNLKKTSARNGSRPKKIMNGKEIEKIWEELEAES